MKMHGRTISWRIALVLAAIPLVFIVLHFHHIDRHKIAASLWSHKSAPSMDFVSEILDHQVSDPLDLSVISNLCQNRPPRSDVIVSCNPGTGGVGNIRSYMLHCTRFAMEAGASMLLPRFTRRAKNDLFELNGEPGDFEHFFDRRWFIESLQTACPHMRVHENIDPGWTMGGMEIPHWPVTINESTIKEPSPWRLEFDKWFAEDTVNKEKPVMVGSGDPGRDRGVMDDGMEFYFVIGRLLQFRPDARRLAALCMAEISRRFHLNIDPKKNIYEKSWMGAHLRTSSDAVKAGWNPDFEQQTDWYIGQALEHGLHVLFAAGGNDLDLQRFATKAKKRGVDVVSKYDLLFHNDRRELDNLLWDQRGLVDFEILLRGSQYGGYSRSSFSHNIAFRRRFNSEIEDPWTDPENHYHDELSVVYGRFDGGWEAETVRTMWP